MRTLAIDPGNTESAYVLIDDDYRPIEFAKVPNEAVRDWLHDCPWLPLDRIFIEMIASYGMPVGAEVFETCVSIGRFIEAALDGYGVTPELIKRDPIKLHHCHSAKAKDSNIVQALVDRFAPGQSNFGKGTKANPGWFYGFSKDVWQAYALAVYAADKALGRAA